MISPKSEEAIRLLQFIYPQNLLLPSASIRPVAIMLSWKFFILSLTSVAASKSSYYCVAGIGLVVGEFSFASTNGSLETDYEEHCSNPLFIDSL
jgi:hypothetical protein